MNASTAFALANTIQSNVAGARARLVERRRSRRAARCGSSALRSLRRRALRAGSTSSAACSRGRVTRMRLPNSGRASNHRRCSRSAATRPDDQHRRTAIGRLASTAAAISSSVPTMRLLRRQRAVVDHAPRSRRPGGRARAARSSDLRQLIAGRRSRRSCRRAAPGWSSRPTPASCRRLRVRGRTSACRRRRDR